MNEGNKTHTLDQAEEQAVKKILSMEKGSHFSRVMYDLHPKRLLHQENFISVLPYIFFLSALAMLYISNSYYAERTIRDIYKATNDLKEMRSEYISTKSELMLMSKQSEVARAVAEIGLKESVVPPKKIVVAPKP